MHSFLGHTEFSRESWGVVTPAEALWIYCSKMVKIPMKCTLDNLKVIVVLRLKTNLTSILIKNPA